MSDYFKVDLYFPLKIYHDEFGATEEIFKFLKADLIFSVILKHNSITKLLKLLIITSFKNLYKQIFVIFVIKNL